MKRIIIIAILGVMLLAFPACESIPESLTVTTSNSSITISSANQTLGEEPPVEELPSLPPELVITKSAKEMTLSVNEFSLGWQLKKADDEKSEFSRRTFSNGIQTIQVSINVFSTTKEAMAHYTAGFSDTYETYSTDMISQGNEGYIYTTPDSPQSFWLFFRNNNVYVRIITTNLSINEALEWAQKVDNSIQ